MDAELIVASVDQAQQIKQRNGRYAFIWNAFEAVQNEKKIGECSDELLQKTKCDQYVDKFLQKREKEIETLQNMQINLSLCGSFQVENAVCVLNVLQILQKKRVRESVLHRIRSTISETLQLPWRHSIRVWRKRTGVCRNCSWSSIRRSGPWCRYGEKCTRVLRSSSEILPCR